MPPKVGFLLMINSTTDAGAADLMLQQLVEQYQLSGNFKIHTFTGPGTFKFLVAGNCWK